VKGGLTLGLEATANLDAAVDKSDLGEGIVVDPNLHDQ
jgi:hypothetical protein